MSGETIGLDVGDRLSQFRRLDAAGEIAGEGRLHTNAASIEKHFAKLPAAVAASMEFLLWMIGILSMAIEEAAGDIEFLLKTKYPEALKRIQARDGPNDNKRAIVAVARKLSVILHKLWRTGEDSVPFPA
ncbi:MAG: hypothetical protein IT170_09015 [Bryobacterales bacterium]|nr:hypothetical protein [Bryobacterales bacterium]